MTRPTNTAAIDLDPDAFLAAFDAVAPRLRRPPWSFDAKKSGGGVTTKLFVSTKHNSRLTGELEAEHRILDYPHHDAPALAKLRGLVTSKLAARLDVEKPDLTLLIKALRDDAPLWR